MLNLFQILKETEYFSIAEIKYLIIVYLAEE